MGQVTAIGKIEAHDAVVRLNERGINGEVGRRSRVGLDIHAPLLRVQLVRLQCAVLCENLDLIDELITAIIPKKIKLRFRLMITAFVDLTSDPAIPRSICCASTS